MAKLLRTLPLLGLALTLAFFFSLSAGSARAQTTSPSPATDITPITGPEVTSAFKACISTIPDPDLQAELSKATDSNTVMYAYYHYANKANAASAGSAVPCQTHVPLNGKSFTVSCAWEGPFIYGAVCHMQAPDGSHLDTYGNIGSGYNFTKYSSRAQLLLI